MPAGAVCDCGELTRNRNGRCERCNDASNDRYRRRRAIYNDRRWRLCREVVFVRDDWTCVKCKRRDPQNVGGTLDAHHNAPVLELRDPFDPNQCVTVCSRCHKGVARRPAPRAY